MGINKENGTISIVWSVEDVLTVRPDLAYDEAFEVLERVYRGHDATIGISWETLKVYAEDIPVKKQIEILGGGIKAVPMLVRLVQPGDRYGRNGEIVRENMETLVEFYDLRHPGFAVGNPENIPGQFISRYLSNTIMEIEKDGLNLDGGVPDWTVGEKAIGRIQQWIRLVDRS